VLRGRGFGFKFCGLLPAMLPGLDSRLVLAGQFLTQVIDLFGSPGRIRISGQPVNSDFLAPQRGSIGGTVGIRIIGEIWVREKAGQSLSD
jgi:hypothetical protein